MNIFKKIAIPVCVLLTTFTIVVCGQAKEDEIANIEESSINRQESNMQTSGDTDLEMGESETVNVDEFITNQQESNVQITENINPEMFPVGEYHDDMGSQLIITQTDDKNYTVGFGIYKLLYTENAVGSYNVNSGILSFSGTDICTESIISADVTIQGDNLVVTLTNSEYPDCPTGTTFDFEPGQP